MLTVYFEEKSAPPVYFGSLPNTVNELHQHLLSMFADRNHQWVAEIYDITGQLVTNGHVDPSWLSYAIVGRTPNDLVKWRPTKITLRKTDKTGHVMFKHPSTTLTELQLDIQKLTGVGVQHQQLLHKGSKLQNTTSTIESIDLKQSSIIHLIDLQQRQADLQRHYTLYAQTAQSFSQIYQIQVTNGFSVLRLKECISQIFEIPVQNLLITYCGKLINKQDSLLYDYDFVPGAYINAINQKKTFTPKHGQAFQITTKETTRLIPRTQSVLNKSVEKFTTETPSVSVNPVVKVIQQITKPGLTMSCSIEPFRPSNKVTPTEVTKPFTSTKKTDSPVRPPEPTDENCNKENQKKAVTMSFSIQSTGRNNTRRTADSRR